MFLKGNNRHEKISRRSTGCAAWELRRGKFLNYHRRFKTFAKSFNSINWLLFSIYRFP